MYVHPTTAQFTALQALPQDEPIVMLNLLRFAAEAREGHGCDGMTGAEAYAEYGRRLGELDPAVFVAQPFWSGTGGTSVIGPDDEQWDQMILVRYESIAAFVGMVTNPEYLAASEARTAGVEDSRLVLLYNGTQLT